MKLTVQMVTRGRMQQTHRAISSILTTLHGIDAELRVFDSGSDARYQQWLREFGRQGIFHVTLVRDNPGYVGGHNAMAKLALGEFVCVVSNDVILGRHWAPALLAPFTDPTVQQTSPVHLFRVLDPTGLGVVSRNGTFEYCDGSCFIVRKNWIQREGFLFDPKFQVGYCEDADLSLRIRASGGKIIQVPITFHRDESQKTPVDGRHKQQFWNHNHRYLQTKWSHYLRTRQFT